MKTYFRCFGHSVFWSFGVLVFGVSVFGVLVFGVLAFRCFDLYSCGYIVIPPATKLGPFYLPRASLFHPPSSPSPCTHLPLDFQERRTSLGYRPRGDWCHSHSYRTQWLRQWPGLAWTHWRTCNLFWPLCRTRSCSRWRAFWVKLHLSRRSVPLSRQTWAKTH